MEKNGLGTPEREVGVLWAKTSRKGNEYYSGKVTVDGKNMEIVVFRITSKNPRGPAMRIIESHFIPGETYEGHEQ